MFDIGDDEEELPGAPFIEGFRLARVIGEGGFGIVYEAEQIVPIRRRVAVKVLKPGLTTRQILARFEAERQALARLDHPHIAKVHDAGETDDGRPYIVMELVKGCTINQLPAGTSQKDKLSLFLDVCRAVAHAHRRAIIHRDLKPSNVLVTKGEDGWTPRIIDFGIAKALDAPLSETPIFTALRMVIGTPGYMSPEQSDPATSAADTRVDTFALGAILHQMLTGAPPEIKRDALGAASRQLNTRSLPREVSCIIAKATEIDTEARYQTADALADEVDAYLQGRPVGAASRGALYLLGKWARRHRAAAAACVITAVALVVAFVAVARSHRIERAALKADADAAGDLRRAFSSADFDMGVNFAEQGRLRDAIKLWCRALLTAPANRPAAARVVDALQTQPVLRPQGVPRPLPMIPVQLLEISASGRCVVALQHKGGGEHALQRWNGLRATAEMAPPHQAVIAMAVADTGHVLMGESDGTVRLWFPDGELSEIGRHSSAVRSIAIAPDASRGVSVSDREAMEWNADGIRAGDPLETSTAIVDFTATPMLDAAAFAEESGEVHFRDWRDNRQDTWNLGGKGEVTKLGLSVDGRLLVAATPNGITNTINTVEGSPFGPALNPGAKVKRYVFSLDGKWLAAELPGNSIAVWSTQDWRMSDVLRTEGRIQLLGITSDGERLIASAGNGSLRIWNIGQEGGVGDELPPAQPAQRTAMSAFGDTVVIADPRGENLRLYSLGRCKSESVSFNFGVRPSCLVSGADDGLPFALVTNPVQSGVASVFQWRLSTPLMPPPGWKIPVPPAAGTPIAEQSGSQSDISTPSADTLRTFEFPPSMRQVRCSADARTAACINQAGDEILWQRGGGPRVSIQGSQLVSVTLSSDGSLVAAGDEFGRVTVWQIRGHEAEIRSSFDAGTDPLTALAFGGMDVLVTGARSPIVRVWRWTDGKALSPVLRVPQTVVAVASNAKGDRVAAICENGVASVWAFRGWQPITMPIKAGRKVHGLALSPDGMRLWIAWGDGRLDMHPLPPESLPPDGFVTRAQQAIGLIATEMEPDENADQK